MKALVKLAIVTALVTSCSSNKQPEGGLLVIDVSKNYPEKEILLTDIADVTYLHLNSDSEDYVYRGPIRCVAENKGVVIDGVSESILFFSKDGTPKSRFNRRGQGPEDYTWIRNVIYDEAADEIFVYDNRKTQVYSSIGEFKRTIKHPQGTEPYYIIDFDDRSLFFFDASALYKVTTAQFEETDLPAEDYILPFYRISKTTGEVLDYVELQGTDLILGAYYAGRETRGNKRWVPTQLQYATKCPEGVLLLSAQTDTIYLYSADKPLTPYLYKTPSITSQNPMECLRECLDRGQYQFIQVTIMREDAFPIFYPFRFYMRNKMTGETVRPKFLLPDYQGKEFIMDPYRPNADGIVSNDGVITDGGYCFELGLYELKEAYRAGKLSGQLKELVATLDENNDNNVFMLVEFKSN